MRIKPFPKISGYRTVSIDRKQVNTHYNVQTSPTHFIVYGGRVIENFTSPVFLEKTLNWYIKRLERLNN